MNMKNFNLLDLALKGILFKYDLMNIGQSSRGPDEYRGEAQCIQNELTLLDQKDINQDTIEGIVDSVFQSRFDGLWDRTLWSIDDNENFTNMCKEIFAITK